MKPWIEFIKEAMAAGESPEAGTVRYLETYFPGFLRSAYEIADTAIADAKKYLNVPAEDFPLDPVELLVQVMATRE